MKRTLKSSDWFAPDGFPIAVERREPQEPFGPHGHEFSELVLVTGGRAKHVIGKDSWDLSTGDVFVIGGERTHDYRDLDALRLVNVLFQPEKLALDLADLPSLSGYHALFTLEPHYRARVDFRSRLHLSPTDLTIASALVDQLEAELRERPAGFAFVCRALFMQLIAHLSRCYSQSRRVDDRAVLRLGEAISHLQRHFTEPVSLDRLAGIAHVSKRSFLRLFRKATGTSPIDYLLQLRVQHAARLLRTTDAAITDVAFQCGFSDSNYFARQFRKLMGQSPRDYRRTRQAMWRSEAR